MNQVFQSVGSQANVIYSLAMIGVFFVSMCALAIILTSATSKKAEVKIK